MRTIRKADFFYPGFELAGVETHFERTLTRIFCFAAQLGVGLFEALSAPNRRRGRGLAEFEG
jgi:hypothetical protein